MQNDKNARARKVYDTMVRALKAKEWKFDEHPEDLTITSGYSGEDIPIHFIVKLDAEREVLQFVSQLPFKMSEEKRVDGAIAVCVANYGMVNGSFDYDINDGEIRFRLTTSTCGCEIGEEFFMNMFAIALLTIDRYNDRFLMLDKGALTLQQFIEKEGD